MMVQFGGDTEAEARDRAQALIDAAQADGGHSRPHVAYITDPEVEDNLWSVRELGLGATAYPPGKHETHEGWEDAAVPPERLGDYLRDFRILLARHDYHGASLYGHFGHGCVHTRIPFELRTREGVANYRSFAEEAADLVVSYGGSLSGEHGDGQSRGELLPKMFGPELIRAFGEVKGVFDPDNRMNPGKVVHPYRLDENLTLRGWFPREPRTFFGYPHDGGKFSSAASRCVGVGKCRGDVKGDGEVGGGVMCPSYRVTREEEHSTRGRARLLMEMVRGEVVTGGWHSTEVRDALDLCLACKGCRKECPVGVDMATYKAEFLAHHYAGRIRPAAHYSMGWLPVLARLVTAAPSWRRAAPAVRACTWPSSSPSSPATPKPPRASPSAHAPPRRRETRDSARWNAMHPGFHVALKRNNPRRKDPPGRDRPGGSVAYGCRCLPAAPGRPAAAAVPAVAARGERADQQRRGHQRDNERDHGVPRTQDGSGEKAADQRGHNADQDRHDDPDVLAAGYEQPGHGADHQSDEQPYDDDGNRECHDLSLMKALGS
jgi:ferredoxin